MVAGTTDEVVDATEPEGELEIANIVDEMDNAAEPKWELETRRPILLKQKSGSKCSAMVNSRWLMIAFPSVIG